MSGTDFGYASYLIVMLVLVGSYFFINNRHQMGKMVRLALVWVFIFIGVLAVIGIWDNLRYTIAPFQRTSDDGTEIELPREADGHYYAMLQINGVTQKFMVDTGATQMVLTQDAARRVGLEPEKLVYSGSASTANGEVRTAPVRLKTVTLGPVTDHNVRAMVNQGDLDLPLLGMSYLSRFSKIEIEKGALKLTR